MSKQKRLYEFTDVEAYHIITCLLRAIDDGWYYGNRVHFDKRCARISEELHKHSTPPTPGGEQR